MKKTELMTSSAIVSVFTFLVGGFDSLLVSLLIIMGLDFLTGICKAIYKKELNSTIGVKGILKKFGYLLIVISEPSHIARLRLDFRSKNYFRI